MIYCCNSMYWNTGCGVCTPLVSTHSCDRPSHHCQWMALTVGLIWVSTPTHATFCRRLRNKLLSINSSVQQNAFQITARPQNSQPFSSRYETFNCCNFRHVRHLKRLRKNNEDSSRTVLPTFEKNQFFLSLLFIFSQYRTYTSRDSQPKCPCILCL